MLFLLDTDHITLYREENLPLQRRERRAAPPPELLARR
jgi:hypothetical protein